jgi:flagellar basal body-associated protein FliL
MAEKTRSSKSTWIIIAVVVIVVLLFAGLLPMPGQKNNTTPNVQPSAPGTQPAAEAPKGPTPSAPADAGANVTAPPPGGAPSASPGSVNTK